MFERLAWIGAAGELQLRLQVARQGFLTADRELSPAGNLEVLSSGSVKDVHTCKTNKRISIVDPLLQIESSAITVYPSDVHLGSDAPRPGITEVHFLLP